MNSIAIVFTIILCYGILGFTMIRQNHWKSATSSIDSPSKVTRRLHRTCIFGAAFLASFLFSPFLIVHILPAFDIRDKSEAVRITAALLYPLPLATLFYWLLIKFCRLTARKK